MMLLQVASVAAPPGLPELFDMSANPPQTLRAAMMPQTWVEWHMH